MTETKLPDLIFFRSHRADAEGQAKPPMILDFTVCHPLSSDIRDKVRMRIRGKTKKYEHWKKGAADVVPMVLTSMATLPTQSFKTLQDLEIQAAIKSGFAQDASARMKVALVKWDYFRTQTRRSAEDTV